MLRSFFQRLRMVLLFSGVQFICGLLVALFGIWELATFEPLPADSAFDYPVPFEGMLWLVVFVGLACSILAWIWTPKKPKSLK